MRRVPLQSPVPDATDPAPGGGGSGPLAIPQDDEENTVKNAAPVAPSPRMSSGTSHANLIGHVLAERYKLVKLIGEGGMGSVYQAEHITIGRKLAIKVLAPEYCDSPEVVARFLQEARTASMLHHEHIVDITDFGYTKQGLAFLTMEYLEGEDLATLLQREGRQPWARLRRMILQVCRALHAAHEKGIVHRDMKPDNCFRIKRGGNHDFIKILDFGIARLANPQDSIVTQTGVVMGTPDFMAPEQAMGKHVDHRADIYSLGASAYALLTGRPPFEGANEYDVIYKQLNDHPAPPSEVAPVAAGVPKWLDKVILRTLRKDPDERHASMRELADALREAQALATSPGFRPELPAPGELEAAAEARAGKRVSPLLWVAVAVAIAAAAGVGYTVLAG